MFLPSRNLYKCKQVAYSVVVACLLLIPFYTDVVAILLSIIFLFRAFVYHFKNIFAIFATILCLASQKVGILNIAQLGLILVGYRIVFIFKMEVRSTMD